MNKPIIYSGMSQHHDQQSKVSPQALRALGKTKPELLKSELEMSLAGVLEEYFQAGQELLERAHWGDNLDLEDLLETVQEMHPVYLVNQLVYANRDLDLQRLPKLPPLEPLKAVLRMLTSSDRYQTSQET